MIKNEKFKNGAIDIWFGIAIDKQILAWTVSTLTNIIENFA
jgi:hypothetical protein